MKLTKDQISNFDNIIQVCGVVNIEDIIIENSTVRGNNEKQNCFITSSVNVPTLDYPLCLRKLSLFKQRLKAFNVDIMNIETKKASVRDEIYMLIVSQNKMKTEYICASPSLLKIPKSINDIPILSLNVSQDDCKNILTTSKIMSSDKTSFIFKRSGDVVIVAEDSTSNKFEVELSNKYVPDEEITETFSFSYPSDMVYNLFKINSNTAGLQIQIGENGVLYVDVLGYKISLLPLVDEIDEGD